MWSITDLYQLMMEVETWSDDSFQLHWFCSCLHAHVVTELIWATQEESRELGHLKPCGVNKTASLTSCAECWKDNFFFSTICVENMIWQRNHWPVPKLSCANWLLVSSSHSLKIVEVCRSVPLAKSWENIHPSQKSALYVWCIHLCCITVFRLLSLHTSPSCASCDR